MTSVLAFDIETIPDIAGLRAFYAPFKGKHRNV